MFGFFFVSLVCHLDNRGAGILYYSIRSTENEATLIGYSLTECLSSVLVLFLYYISFLSGRTPVYIHMYCDVMLRRSSDRITRLVDFSILYASKMRTCSLHSSAQRASGSQCEPAGSVAANRNFCWVLICDNTRYCYY